jgi:hypothetical protein
MVLLNEKRSICLRRFELYISAKNKKIYDYS